MLIEKKSNYYTIKLQEKILDVANKKELKQIIKRIINKLEKTYKLKSNLIIELFIDKNYGTIIKLIDYGPYKNDKEIRILVNKHNTFLYQTDYFNIKKKNKKNTYYLKGNYYIELKENITKKDYLNIIEKSILIYDESDTIISNSIKL